MTSNRRSRSGINNIGSFLELLGATIFGRAFVASAVRGIFFAPMSIVLMIALFRLWHGGVAHHGFASAWSSSAVATSTSTSTARFRAPFSSMAQAQHHHQSTHTRTLLPSLLPQSLVPIRTKLLLRAAPDGTVSDTQDSQQTANNTIAAITTDSIPCPLGLSYLPFQKEAVLDYLVPSSSIASRRGILLGDEMGLGKTISVIGGINVLLRDHYSNSRGDNVDGKRDEEKAPRRFRALIVAPKSVLPHWEHELNRWIVLPPNAVATEKDPSDEEFGANATENINNDTEDDDDSGAKPQIGIISAKDGIPAKACDIYLINYEIVGKYLEEINSLFGSTESDDADNGGDGKSPDSTLDVLVCDECHYLKSVDSQRTHATLGHHKHPSSQPGVAGIAERLWLVTGSPVLNTPLELFPLLHALVAKPLESSDNTTPSPNPVLEGFPELASLEAFRDRYCGKQVTPWGVTYRGGKNLSELRNRLIRPLASKGSRVTPCTNTPLLLRRTKRQVLPDLPNKRHQLFPLDDGGIAASEEFELLEKVLKEKASDNTSNNGLETHLRGLKVNDLKDLSRERGLPVAGRKAELIERLLGAGPFAKAIPKVDLFEEIPNPPPVPDEDAMNEDSMVSKEGSDKDVIDIRSSALSVLQSAPSENRKSILRDLLQVPRILGTNDQNLGSNALLGALGRARHRTALRKVPYVIELLEIALRSHKVVVFSHHRDVQEAIARAFADRAVALNGDTPAEERMQVVQKFQTDPSTRLFVGSLRASGLGISLTAASHVVFVEMDWSPSIVQQAEDRCHRVGQTASVLVQYLFFEGTIDEHLSQLLVEKQRTVAATIEEPQKASWVFDFGKHSGEAISDVAAEDPAYLKWLVDQDIHTERRTKGIASTTASDDEGENDCEEERDGLTKALMELGFLNQQGQKTSNQNSSLESSHGDANETDGDVEEAGDYIMTFGKHRGKALREIPNSYLVWMSDARVARGNPGLTKALRIHLANSSSRVPKSSAP